MFTFTDRLGSTEALTARAGETVRDVLLRADVPPLSVLVVRDGKVVSDDHRLEDGRRYDAALIEGYDIATIRAALRRLITDPGDAAYVERRLAFGIDGSLNATAAPLDLDAVSDTVEQRVAVACEEFGLLPRGASVMIGLSGGVDSSALLIALAALRGRQRPDVRIVAATFEDADSTRSPAFARAAALARRHEVEHVLVPGSRAQEVFHLSEPLDAVLPALISGLDAHHAMYVDHHTTRRVLEVEAARLGIERIALGLHTTDIVAGLLNGFMTGYVSGNLPERAVGDFIYIYPLAFVSKKELHLYHLQRTGRLATHTTPNQWERRPTDRSFYYWLADRMQDMFPALEVLLLAAQQSRARSLARLVFVTCTNCGGAQLQQPFHPVEDGLCDVCRVLDAAEFIVSKEVSV